MTGGPRGRTSRGGDAAASAAAASFGLSPAAIRSGVVQLTAQAVQLALYFVAAVVLARLLTPADFGLYAMVATLSAFAASFKDFGFSMAVVQRESVDEHQKSALFWLSMKLNLVTGVILAAMGPALAWFYGRPELTPMASVLAAGTVVLGLAAQHESHLIREMRFRRLATVDVLSLGGGIAVGITCAALGAGYWSLVVQFVSSAVLRSAAIVIVSGWRPASYRAGSAGAAGLAPMLSYARYLTAFRVLTHLGRNLDRVLVGYFSGAGAMGLYDNAYRWSLYPVQQVYVPLGNVAVAGLSRAQGSRDAYLAFCRSAFLVIFSTVMPALVFMAVQPRLVLLVLLGSQWLPAVPLFQLLCVAAFATCLTKVTKWIYLSVGETKRQFTWSLVNTPLMMAAVAAGVPWGPYGVAAGFTAGTLLLAVPGVLYCLKRSPLTFGEFAGIAAPPALASIGAGAVVLALDGVMGPEGSAASALLVRLAAYGAVYLLLWSALPGCRRAAIQMLALLLALRPSTASAVRDTTPDHVRS